MRCLRPFIRTVPLNLALVALVNCSIWLTTWPGWWQSWSPYITFQRKTRILLYYRFGSPIHSPLWFSTINIINGRSIFWPWFMDMLGTRFMGYMEHFMASVSIHYTSLGSSCERVCTWTFFVFVFTLLDWSSFLHVFEPLHLLT